MCTKKGHSPERVPGGEVVQPERAPKAAMLSWQLLQRRRQPPCRWQGPEGAAGTWFVGESIRAFGRVFLRCSAAGQGVLHYTAFVQVKRLNLKLKTRDLHVKRFTYAANFASLIKSPLVHC